MNPYSFVFPRATAHKRSLQDGGVTVITKSKDEKRMIEYPEICIIKIENINRELSPYQKCRLIEEVRKGEEKKMKAKIKSCKTCKNRDGPSFDGPCLGCSARSDFNHWEEDIEL